MYHIFDNATIDDFSELPSRQRGGFAGGGAVED
jgi:hypothetical protein